MWNLPCAVHPPADVRFLLVSVPEWEEGVAVLAGREVALKCKIAVKSRYFFPLTSLCWGLLLCFFTFLLLSQHARTAIIAAHTGKSSVMAGGLIPTRSVETASYTLSPPPFPARPLTLRIRPHHSRTHRATTPEHSDPDRPIVSGGQLSSINKINLISRTSSQRFPSLPITPWPTSKRPQALPRPRSPRAGSPAGTTSTRNGKPLSLPLFLTSHS